MTFVGEHRRASVRDLTRPVGCHGGFFFFAFGWRGSLFLTFKPLLLRRRRWIRPRKSGGPPLFELSLKVQRDVAHYPPPGSRSCPGTTASTRSALKRSQRCHAGLASDAHARGMIGSHPTHRTLTSGLPRVSWGTLSPALRAARDKRRLHELQRWRRKTHLGLSRPLQSF
jgi:hypothetical protein